MNPDWRYRCPNGHASYRVMSSGGPYHCQTCREDASIQAHKFDRLLDAKTGELVAI